METQHRFNLFSDSPLGTISGQKSVRAQRSRIGRVVSGEMNGRSISYSPTPPTLFSRPFHIVGLVGWQWMMRLKYCLLCPELLIDMLYIWWSKVDTGRSTLCNDSRVSEVEYSGELVPKAASDEFISVPIKNIQGSTWDVRPSRVMAIQVEFLVLVWNDFREWSKQLL